MGLNVAEHIPEFSGIVMQRFLRHKGEAKLGFKIWIDKIRGRVSTELVPTLIEVGGHGAVRKSCLMEPIIVEIPDFASLAPMMFECGKPVWRLTKQDTGWQGSVWDGREVAMKEFQQKFFGLADLIVAE